MVSLSVYTASAGNISKYTGIRARIYVTSLLNNERFVSSYGSGKVHKSLAVNDVNALLESTSVEEHLKYLSALANPSELMYHHLNPDQQFDDLSYFIYPSDPTYTWLQKHKCSQWGNQDEIRRWLRDYESSNDEVFATFASKGYDQGNTKNHRLPVLYKQLSKNDSIRSKVALSILDSMIKRGLNPRPEGFGFVMKVLGIECETEVLVRLINLTSFGHSSIA